MAYKKLRITVNSISRGEGGAAALQEKTVSSGNQDQTIVPDAGYDGMSKVTVKGNLLQTKTVAPTDEKQQITADAGYTALGQVTVQGIVLQEKAITLTSADQEVTADAGYDGLSKVTVGAYDVDDTLTVAGKAADAAAVGERFRKLTQDTTGAKIVRSGSTVTITATLEDGTQNIEVITEDANGIPTTITRNGKSFYTTWEGFD